MEKEIEAMNEKEAMIQSYKQYEKAMGGEEVIMQGYKQFEKDREFLDRNLSKWRKLYPNHWIAVFMEEIIVVEEDSLKFLEIIDKKNIPDYYGVPRAFLDTKPPKIWIFKLLKFSKELIRAV